MIKQNDKGCLIVISGPSGSGKGSICERLKEYNDKFWVSISCTTRKPRIGDEEGITYYFKTKEQFEQGIKNNDFLEYAKYNDEYYGTPKSEIKKHLDKGIDVILEIEVQGALMVKKLLPNAVFIFIMPPSMEELLKRLKNRGTDDDAKIIKRFKRAYQEINEFTKYNYIVINDDLDIATKKVNSIIMAQKCMVDRIEDVYLNNSEEKIHELLIENKIFVNEDIEL